MIFFRLLLESLYFAYQALVLNKLRSLLSLLGITIGIFCIISVFTMVDTLEENVREGVSSLGDDVVFVQKWPWGGGSDYEWWKYWKRREPSFDEFKLLKEKNTGAQAMCFNLFSNRPVSVDGKTIESVSIKAVSEGYDDVEALKIEFGRYFTNREINAARDLCIVGYEIAVNLFSNAETALGKTLKVGNKKCYIIGILEKDGSAISFNGMDQTVIMPYGSARSIVNIRRAEGAILAKAGPGQTIDELKDRLEGAYRSIRRVRPREESDFALNESSVISGQLDGLFGMINTAGLVIGLFSILVGGFSVANIMFVSVKERTNLIGIQKSLGAKNEFILMQFLFESVFLSILGGLIGLVLIFILAGAVSIFTDFTLMLSVKNVITGLSISTAIGIISGLAPAMMAAKLDPVIAIRSN